jgi:outer membrane immunogenic protein
MKKLLLAVSAMAALSGTAFAADMAPAPAYTKAPVMPAPVYNWTGCYAGGGGGYGLWDQNNTNFDDLASPRTQLTATNSASGRGYFGTLQAGCDYQFGVWGHQFVVGGFGDFDADSLKGTHETPFGNLRQGGSATADERMNSSWAIGGRVGWLVTPSFLTYFSAGYTQASFGTQTFFLNTPTGLPPGGTPLAFFLGKATYSGYFLGAGDEYALGFLPGLFWKTEYRLSSYNTKTLPFLDTTTGVPNGLSDDSHKWVQTVRTELVYRFNWGGPLVTKY